MSKNNLTSKQQKQLQNIGVSLQQMREERHISLDTVAQKTLISQRLLRAIETGDAAELPEPFYIQALVSKYARAIGADTIKFVVESADSETATAKQSQDRRSYGFNFQLRSLHLYLLYILLVVVSVGGITALIERPVIVNQPPEDSPVLVPEEQLENTTQVSQPQTTSSPQFISQSSNSEAVSVGINLQERCWLKVMVDGKVAFEGILPQGTQRQWTGKKEVTIRAGNAGGVVISFNNQQQQILGAPGQVEEITYTVN